MEFKTVAILSPGDMGHAVGRAFKQSGRRIVTCLAGRSARSKGLAESGGFELADTLEEMVSSADLVLSILPPSAAIDTAKAVAAAMQATGQFPLYVDCNAISPDTTKTVGGIIQNAGASYLDAGIVGPPPGKGNPRFYVSGSNADVFNEFDGAGIVVKILGPEIGQASAMKMCYAAITKGSFTLYTSALIAAEVFGLTEAYIEEVGSSRPAVMKDMRSAVPRQPLDAGRWIGEMEEIAATFKSVGLSSGFHDGAAETYRMLDRTPIARETRETVDTSRTLEQCLAIYKEYL